MPFILHKRIYFQFLLLHTLHGFTLNLFLICLLISTQNHTSTEIFQSNFLAVCGKLSDYHHIYTDGSKMNNSAAASVVSREEVKSTRIPDKASIFTAELVALNLALDIIWHSSYKNLWYSLPASWIWIRYEVPQKLYSTGEHWWNSSSLLGHIGIRGNEHADDVAKMALHSSISVVKYPPSDLCHDVTTLCYKLWQADWDKLHLLNLTSDIILWAVWVVMMPLFCEECAVVILDFLIRIFSLSRSASL